MSTQTTISQFFTSRKRTATDDLQKGMRNKVLKIEECVRFSRVETKEITHHNDILPTSPHYNPKKTPQFDSLRQVVKCVRSQSAEKVKKRLFQSSQQNNGDKDAAKEKHGGCARKIVDAAEPHSCNKTEEISAKEESKNEEISEILLDKLVDAVGVDNEEQEDTLSTPIKPSTLERCTSIVKENKSNLKKKLSRSGRLANIKEALGNLNDKISKLSKQTEEVKAEVPPSPSKTLARFDPIQVEVISSPIKSASEVMREADAMVAAAPGSLPSLRQNLFRSPAKQRPTTAQLPAYTSPRKLMLEGARDGVTVSAYERYAALACSAGRSTLPLPQAYRTLGELFRSVDAVCAMMSARNELITFANLKPSVQRITCKTLTENHLGQMLTIMPDAFKLEYKGFGSKKQLVLSPPAGENGAGLLPAKLLERKRAFYHKLISITKDYHQAFLEQLEHPLIVDKEKVTRWHPQFEIDRVPPIPVSDLLPAPPAPSNAPTAAKVLEGAKDMLFANERMRAALGRLDSLHTAAPQETPTPAAEVVPELTKVLAGIPKGLLEKVRAREAAKAAAMLTQPPEDRQRSLRLLRLPKIARIVRNVFIAERRNVIDRPRVLDKIVSSYPDSLSTKDLDAHLSLMIEKAPHWLSISKFDNVEYIRMDKTVDINKLDFSS